PPASRCARGAAGVPPARAAVAVPVHSDAPGAADGAGCDASMPRFVVLPARVRGTPRAFAGGGHARARSIRPVSASWTAPEVSTFSSTPAKATAANVPTAYSAVDMPLSPRIFEANRPPQLGFVTPRIRPGLHSSSRARRRGGRGRGPERGSGRFRAPPGSAGPGSLADGPGAAAVGAFEAASVRRGRRGQSAPGGAVRRHRAWRRQALGQRPGRSGPGPGRSPGAGFAVPASGSAGCSVVVVVVSVIAVAFLSFMVCGSGPL